MIPDICHADGVPDSGKPNERGEFGFMGICAAMSVKKMKAEFSLTGMTRVTAQTASP